MRRHHELMDRLTAADPLRDGEQLTSEAQREADALLARLLATPVEPDAEPRRPASRLRRRALAVAAAACAAVAVLVAIDLVDSDTPGSGVVDKAVAAVTRAGVVYHVIEFKTELQRPSDVPAGAPREGLLESWYTSDGRLHRKTFATRDGQKGRLVKDFAGRRRPGGGGGPALLWTAFSNEIGESGFGGGKNDGEPFLDSFAAPGAQLRALQEQGRLRVAATTSVDGKRAYRLVSDKLTVDGIQVEIEYTVDAESYLPLSDRVSQELEGGTLEVLTRYRVYERLPLDDQNSRQLALDAHADAKCSQFAHELTNRDLGFPNPCASGEG